MAQCSACGSVRIEIFEAEYPTGVTGPAGGEERRRAIVVRCRDCGGVEELNDDDD